MQSQDGQGRKLYMNPPYDAIGEMIDQVVRKGAATVTMVLPEWKSERWYSKIEPFIVQRWPQGSMVFEGPPGYPLRVRGTPWPVIAIHLPNGHIG